MKFRLSLFICISLTIIFINGCSGKINNSVTFNNLALGTVYVNFRGEAINVTSGNSVVVQEIPNGTYNYATTFSLPAGAIGGSLQGDYKGTMTIAAGTKITILYSSTFINGSYILYATISNSDDQGSPTGP
jgi:hypothetical protein